MFSSILLIWRGGPSALWVTIPTGVVATVVAIAAGWLIKRSPATIWPFRLSMLAAGLIVLGFLGAVSRQTL
jgi:zinc transporter ZupT